LGEDQDVVDQLAVDARSRQITDDDARPTVGGLLEAERWRALSPPRNLILILNGDDVAASSFARAASAVAS
jgi:hypothetical protein